MCIFFLTRDRSVSIFILMKNPELTRQKILEESSTLFNLKGYAGSSISDIMTATGLKKGGVYNHFNSKQELSIEAFRYSVQKISKFLSARILRHTDPLERLYAIPDTFVKYALHPVVEGGCPLINTAVEVDDGDAVMRDEAREAMARLKRFTEALFRKAKEEGRIKPEVNEKEESILFIAALEGGVLMTRLDNSDTAIKAVCKHLKNHIKSLES